MGFFPQTHNLEPPSVDLAGGCRGCDPHPLPPKMNCGFLIKLLFCQKKKETLWFIGFEVKHETRLKNLC